MRPDHTSSTGSHDDDLRSSDWQFEPIRRRRRAFALELPACTFPSGAVAVLGSNGAGKSTWFQALAASPGLVHHAGYDAPQPVLVPQSFRLPALATVRQVAEYAARVVRIGRAERGAVVESALASVGLSAKADAPCRTLSGGEARRAGLAMATLDPSPVILLDEPTAGLDPIEARRFHLALRDRIDGEAPSIALVSTHLAADLEGVADSVLVLSDGRLCFAGPTEDFLALGDGAVDSYRVAIGLASSQGDPC